jgi:hypothetical protein
MIDAPPSARSLRAELPEAWEQFLMVALAKDPTQRYASAHEMRAALPPD